MTEPFSFRFAGKLVTSDHYGAGYLEELRETATRALDAGGCVLEWGSGISTLLLADLIRTLDERPLTRPRMANKLVTIDNNEPYLKAVLAAMPDQQRVIAVACDLVGPCRDQLNQGLSYTTVPFALMPPAPWKLIVIDGRRRLECTLTAAMLASKDTVIMLHDYRRLRYQPILGLCDIVADQPQYRVLRVNSVVLSALAPVKARMLPAYRDAALRAQALADIKILCG
jgi:hypothetical protein